MFGLAVLAAFAIYLLISGYIVSITIRWAKNQGRNPTVWGLLSGLLMYHLVFWDLVPTYALFKYYCHTKSGFWVYKTPEQWKLENPGVAETLTWKDNSEYYYGPGVDRGYQFNERIAWVFIESHPHTLDVATQEELLIDTKTQDTLVKRVTIYSGSKRSNKLRFWVRYTQPGFKLKEYRALKTAYKKLGKKIE